MGIQLTDAGFGQPPIEILIGFDFAGKIHTGVINELTDGLFAVQTELGWMIMGKTLGKPEQESYGSALTSLLIHPSDVTNLWSLESIGITNPVETQSKEEMKCAVEKHFKETIFVNEEERYSVSLSEELPTNFEVAEKRLVSTTYKLRNVEKFIDYDKSFESWKEDGIITECSMEG
ncbi:hypothetical protein HNY73_016322 [Argiope bruennichi]|uniref:Peptidase aspartic putative domain-containing protein n=1 Tax=Argiope bruennichi TaxID=94029 RepID=A0A8T0EIG3_ARGBR|nr:hypothetical protein HNY73_016322 [Argiope bruennichi]